MNTLMQKAIANQTFQGYKEQENRKAIKDWARTPEIPLPKYEEIKVAPNKAGWINFMKNLRP